MTPDFPPTRRAALERVAAIDARAYARTRNALDGRVTGLGPYLTHGLVSVPDVLAALDARRVSRQEKIVFELAWREYWHHVWRHAGDGIFSAMHPGPAGAPGLDAMPVDILEARTGVPVIDASVRALYDTGYVHNHARMWVASYVVHVRKVDWRAGARWFYTHLLDGDLASNTLSWQWVAGTFSSKPYLFNDDNVAKYAPSLSKRGTVIDATYDALDAIARSARRFEPEPDAPAEGVAEPAASARAELPETSDPDAAKRTVHLVHPWSLGERPKASLVIGVLHTPFHEAHPWSARRWDFVLTRMREVCDVLWQGDLRDLAPALAAAESVESVATLNPGYHECLPALCGMVHPAPRAFADPPTLKRSFSQFWHGLDHGR